METLGWNFHGNSGHCPCTVTPKNMSMESIEKIQHFAHPIIFTTTVELRIFAGWKTWKCWTYKIYNTCIQQSVNLEISMVRFNL